MECTSKSGLLECSQAFKKQTQDTKKICISFVNSISIYVSKQLLSAVYADPKKQSEVLRVFLAVNKLSFCLP